MRIDRLLVLQGYGSRTQVQGLIRAGRVTVKGAVVTDPSVQVQDTVRVDHKEVDTRLFRCIMMNKPAGVLTAADDKKQKTVMDLLPPVYKSLDCMPVGRLDKDTTGLLLFTTDGTLAHKLISPKSGIEKVYEAQVDSDLRACDAEAFSRGIPFKEFTALPAKLEILTPRTCLVTVAEGKFHQVKRMLHAVGHETLALRRIAFGPFTLDESLNPGEFRELTREEEDALRSAARIQP